MKQFAEHIDLFICPACKSSIRLSGDGGSCNKCEAAYGSVPGIIRFLSPGKSGYAEHPISEKINKFYESNPFPDYQGTEDAASLIDKAKRGGFAARLDREMPFKINVLEVGCGTGQLSNFLSIGQRNVFAVDMSLNALQLAEKFRANNELQRVGFYQMDLFNPCFKEDSFPIVICNGVLHHTPDPFAGFKSISKLVEKGGYILIGLYNTYGRSVNDLRRMVFKLLRNRPQILDPRIKKSGMSGDKLESWLSDQYHNPHESKHSISEVMGWFEESGFEYISSIPSASAQGQKESMFDKQSAGNWLTQLTQQLSIMLTPDNEGGFFVMIGRKQ